MARPLRRQRAAVHRHPRAQADARQPALHRARPDRALREGGERDRLRRGRAGAGVVRLQFLPVRRGAGVVSARRRVAAGREHGVRLRAHPAAAEAAAALSGGGQPLRRAVPEGGRDAVPRGYGRTAPALREPAAAGPGRSGRRAAGAAEARPAGLLRPRAAARRGRTGRGGAAGRAAQRVPARRAPRQPAALSAGLGAARARRGARARNLRPRAGHAEPAPGGAPRAGRGHDALRALRLHPAARLQRPRQAGDPGPPPQGTLWQDQQAERGRNAAEGDRFSVPGRAASERSAANDKGYP